MKCSWHVTMEELKPPAWPENGQVILWRRKGTEEWLAETVAFVWVGIEPAIKTIAGRNIFPTLGDEWKPVTPTTPEGTP